MIAGAAVLIMEKLKQKPKSFVKPVFVKKQMPLFKTRTITTKPLPPSLEQRKKQILERIKKQKQRKTKQRKQVFEAFEKRKPSAKPKSAPFKKQQKKPAPEKPSRKIKIPEKKAEFERLAELTKDYLTKKTTPEKIIKLTGTSKKDFDELRKLIKQKTGITKPVKKLTTNQKKEIKNIFSKLKNLKKKTKK